jgi:hypothetical protein
VPSSEPLSLVNEVIANKTTILSAAVRTVIFVYGLTYISKIHTRIALVFDLSHSVHG